MPPPPCYCITLDAPSVLQMARVPGEAGYRKSRRFARLVGADLPRSTGQYVGSPATQRGEHRYLGRKQGFSFLPGCWVLLLGRALLCPSTKSGGWFFLLSIPFLSSPLVARPGVPGYGVLDAKWAASRHSLLCAANRRNCLHTARPATHPS